MLDESIGSLKNQLLDQYETFEKTNATAEAVTKVIFDRLAPKLPSGSNLAWIEVTEAPGCRIRYTAD